MQRTIGTAQKPCYVASMTEKTPKDDTKAQYLRESAERALKEAEERRAAIDAAAEAIKGERDGPKRLEPTRFGDWEKKGITSDF